jgi:hypothetical protein
MRVFAADVVTVPALNCVFAAGFGVLEVKESTNVVPSAPPISEMAMSIPDEVLLVRLQETVGFVPPPFTILALKV